MDSETEVSLLTWRDELATWPQPITSDRNVVTLPESLGFVLRRGDDEAEFVAWTGGWADQGFLISGQVELSSPEFTSVQECVDAVANLLSNWHREHKE
jgi:hypothetical protein